MNRDHRSTSESRWLIRRIPEGGGEMSRLTSVAVLLALAVGPTVTAAAETTAEPRITVGPNILVSRDGDLPHVELILAANPKNAKNLVGGAITYTRPGGGFACRAYATTDGGAVWHASEFAEQVKWGGGDPYVAFTPHGTAIFTALAFAEDEKGQSRAVLHAWRSEDGGLSWDPPADLGYSFDFEKMAVDQTTGRFAGRAYIAALHGYPEYLVSVFRSEDDGRSWIGPVQAASGGGTKGVGAVNVLILSDGTLIVPITEYEFLPDKVKFTGKGSRGGYLVLSTDGGVSFTRGGPIPEWRWDMDDPKWRDIGSIGSVATDPGSKKYRDRIYMVWPDSRFGKLRILFSYSGDRGGRWSEPVPVDASVPPEAYQFQSVVAVNKDGVVGVSWYDTRHSVDASTFDEYFAASVDGGRSFLPPVRVSSSSSTFRGAGNMRVDPLVFEHKDETYLTLISAVSRWPSGGDYLGLTADRDGVFHPFWADARTGTFQAYTASVTVELPPPDEVAGAGPAAATATSPTPTQRTRLSLSGRAELLFDPTRYDGSTREAEIPVRLRNTSTEPIYPPITLEVLGFGFNDPEVPKDDSPAPVVVNASNGKPGDGALFDFAGALGTREALEPGGITSPVVLRLRFEDPSRIPSIRFRVEGLVEPQQ
jgi:hypothetical protein